jgi:hypothetical protein
MAFDANSSIQEWRQLVEIALTGKTLRFARDPVTFTMARYTMGGF